MVTSVERQITIALGEYHGIAGESIVVPLEIDDAPGLAAGDISIYYDKTVLRAVDVLSGSGPLIVGNLSEPGNVRISFAGTDRLNSSTLAEIRFRILADEISSLAFRKAEFYGIGDRSIESRTVNGQFSSWRIPPEQKCLRWLDLISGDLYCSLSSMCINA